MRVAEVGSVAVGRARTAWAARCAGGRPPSPDEQRLARVLDEDSPGWVALGCAPSG